MDIGTASKKGTVIVIDPNEEIAKKTKKRLEESMKKIAIINTKCMTPKRQEINDIVRNADYQKMFYGCNISFFNEMVKGFNLNFKDGEIAYIGWKPDIRKIVINYWNYFWKKKDSGVSHSTVSGREGSMFQKL